jgi:undecaprenyl-diphosphatase
MINLDLQISQFFFQLGRDIPIFAVEFLATYLFWVLVVAVLIVSRKHVGNPWRLFLQSGFGSALAYGFSTIIGNLKFRMRPFDALELNPIINVEYPEKSFPSDHASIAFALAFMVFLYNKKYGTILLVIAFLIAIGRILAGVHYFYDIIAGALVGIISAYIFYRFTKNRKIGSWF